MFSLVIPVYRNEESLPELLDQLAALAAKLRGELEVVFVVDASPDRSLQRLEEALERSPFRSQLLLLSRNFGSFAAIRAGLEAASGSYFAVMAADLQEPIALVAEFFECLESERVDVVVGERIGRADPPASRLASRVFWATYRRLVDAEMPRGGVDVFGCNAAVRDQLLSLREANSSLVGLLFWMGFRRKAIPYERLPRRHGRSAWSLSRKLRYLSDSLFSFSDLPVRVLIAAGALGMLVSAGFGTVVLVARLRGLIEVPGYAATILTITFFAALNTLGLGIIGSYVWRAYENTKGRPEAIVQRHSHFLGKP